MTFEERVHALGYLALTPRQTRFLATVALHSGFCLRRQYACFAGVEYGKNVRNFLDELVGRGLAKRLLLEINRGHVYHVNERGLYRAIDQEENRNRRVTAPALIARKLMLLDFSLSQPADEWLVTEQDKVALFRDRFQVPLSDLPRRVFGASASTGGESVRYFIDKLPIFLAGEPPVVRFVFLATDPGRQSFERFLCDHESLFARLERWSVVLVSPARLVDARACRSAFEEFVAGSLMRPRGASFDGLRWYFETRRAVEQDRMPTVSAELIQRFHEARRRFAGSHFDTLYAAWTTAGEAALVHLHGVRPARTRFDGSFITYELPFSYAQFGKLPGVA